MPSAAIAVHTRNETSQWPQCFSPGSDVSGCYNVTMWKENAGPGPPLGFLLKLQKEDNACCLILLLIPPYYQLITPLLG